MEPMARADLGTPAMRGAASQQVTGRGKQSGCAAKPPTHLRAWPRQPDGPDGPFPSSTWYHYHLES